MEMHPDLIPRACEEGDIQFVHDLSFANMRWFVEKHWGGWKDELFFANKENVIIFEMEAKRVGFFEVAAEGTVMRLRNIQVMQDMQGRGIGKHMMEIALRMTEKRGLSKMILRVFIDNPAVGFYEHLGFCETERDENSIVMEKELAGR
jgi:ribosomal protein S18 acetylase RimI-like enzyme